MMCRWSQSARSLSRCSGRGPTSGPTFHVPGLLPPAGRRIRLCGRRSTSIADRRSGRGAVRSVPIGGRSSRLGLPDLQRPRAARPGDVDIPGRLPLRPLPASRRPRRSTGGRVRAADAVGTGCRRDRRRRRHAATGGPGRALFAAVAPATATGPHSAAQPRLGGVGMRRTVQLWDRVRVAGEDWQAVAVAGDIVALKSADGARLETFTQAELLTAPRSRLRTVPPHQPRSSCGSSRSCRPRTASGCSSSRPTSSTCSSIPRARCRSAGRSNSEPDPAGTGRGEGGRAVEFGPSGHRPVVVAPARPVPAARRRRPDRRPENRNRQQRRAGWIRASSRSPRPPWPTRPQSRPGRGPA